MEAKTTTSEELFAPVDEELKEVLSILHNCEELDVSESGIAAALTVRRERYPRADSLLAAATVTSWATSPTFDGRNAAALLLTAIKKQPIANPRPIQNAPQRENPYLLRTCRRCELDFGVRRNGLLARGDEDDFLCHDCGFLEARWAA